MVRSIENLGCGVPTRHRVSPPHAKGRRIMAGANENLSTTAIQGERLSTRKRPMDFGSRNELGVYGACSYRATFECQYRRGKSMTRRNAATSTNIPARWIKPERDDTF